jgi:hypothetical protein
MFTTEARGKSKNVTFKTGMAILALLFIAVLGPGMLNIATGQALANDDRGDDWDYKQHRKVNACAQTTEAALTACQLAAQEDYNLALGNCYNVSDAKDQKECLKEAKNDLKDAKGECTDQREARQEVCRELGKGPYDPDSDPADFSSDINNTYFPLVQGQTYTYQSEDTEGNIQTIVVTVQGMTTIDGFPCREVTDKVYEGVGTAGNLLEDTIDWFSQDGEGNVWYFGESTIAFTYDDEGNPTPSTEGSWKAGEDGAKPGMIMPSDPGGQIDELYRQEFSLGTAEDLGRVIGTGESVTAGGVPYTGCLHTQDSTPLEPGVIEDKYYAPGVGLVLTLEPDGREELISIIP